MKRKRWEGWRYLSFLLVVALAGGCTAAGSRPVPGGGGPVPAGALAASGCSGCHVSSPEHRQTLPRVRSFPCLKSRVAGNR